MNHVKFLLIWTCNLIYSHSLLPLHGGHLIIHYLLGREEDARFAVSYKLAGEIYSKNSSISRQVPALPASKIVQCIYSMLLAL